MHVNAHQCVLPLFSITQVIVPTAVFVPVWRLQLHPADFSSDSTWSADSPFFPYASQSFCHFNYPHPFTSSAANVAVVIFLAERHPYFTAPGTLAPFCLMPVSLWCLPLPLSSLFCLTLPSFQRCYSALIWLREFLFFFCIFFWKKKMQSKPHHTFLLSWHTFSTFVVVFFAPVWGKLIPVSIQWSSSSRGCFFHEQNTSLNTSF